jgi:hypothetical protein
MLVIILCSGARCIGPHVRFVVRERSLSAQRSRSAPTSMAQKAAMRDRSQFWEVTIAAEARRGTRGGDGAFAA